MIVYRSISKSEEKSMLIFIRDSLLNKIKCSELSKLKNNEGEVGCK